MKKIVSWSKSSPLEIENRFLRTVISTEQFELLENRRSGFAWVENDVGEIKKEYINRAILPDRMYISHQERVQFEAIHDTIRSVTDMILYQPEIREITGIHNKYFGSSSGCLLCHLLNGTSGDFYDKVNPEGSNMYEGDVCAKCSWFLTVREKPIVSFLAV